MKHFETILKIIVYLALLGLVIIFFLGKILENQYLLSFLEFDGNSGILWIIIILLLALNLPVIKSVIREIVRDKIEYLSNEEIINYLTHSIKDDAALRRKLIQDLLREIDKGSVSTPDPGKEISSGTN